MQDLEDLDSDETDAMVVCEHDDYVALVLHTAEREL
jgi:hypothetical protein